MEPGVRTPPKAVPVSMGSPRFKTVDAHGFLVTDAWFSPFDRLPPHCHDRTCFAVMLEGSFDVQFTRVTHACPPCTVVIEPAGERHGNRIERTGAHVLVVQPDPAREDLARTCAVVLDRITRFRHGGIAGLAWRLTRELASPDAVTPLAIEGTALEMLALAARLDDGGPAGRRPPGWLLRATDLLHDRFLDGLRATDVAGEVDVHPVHLARVFRASRVGMSNDPTIPVGTFIWFQSIDNGEGANGWTDASTLSGFGNEAANQAFCNSDRVPNPDFGPHRIGGGNIQVH